MNFEQYRFKSNDKLNDYVTCTDGGLSDDDLKNLRNESRKRIIDLQDRLYAESKQSVLVVLQAMDAAGKDSTIAKLSRTMNAQGCLVHSFKKPTKKELSHDFLWRVHQCVPAQGEITLFNRSHYEDVLVVKVHRWASEEAINQRYDHINNFEALLADRGTKVIKFMLNVSPEYQLQRFRRRLEKPEKHWKFNPGDLHERTFWNDYMEAFETVLQRCNTDTSPWYVVPAENRRFRDAMIATVLADTIDILKPDYPAPDFNLEDYPVDSLK